MARTITREDMVYTSFPIEKQTVEADGSITIYGKATDGTLDSDLQIVDPAWSGPALEKWLRTKGNVRVQHSPHLYPAGKGESVEIDRDGDGAHWVKARIVEPTAVKLVRAGVLQDFSVGIAKPIVLRDTTGKGAKGGFVTGNDQTEIAELSIVDRGSNYNSAFTLVKSADLDVPWTPADLEALLAKVETAELAKSDATKVPDQDKADGKSGKPEADDAQDMAVQEQEDDTDDDEADGHDKPEDTQKSYATARAAWVAREPKAGEQDLGPGTAFLAKRAAMTQWEAWDVEGAEQGLDGTAAGYQTWLAKRNVDPNVGGGVDRDAMDARDFVDPEGRRFPIHSPGDVSDAVSSYGRADPLIPMRRFKARLKAIARRKGAEFEDALPESWSQKDFTLTSPNATGLVPYNLQGQQKPFAGAPDDDEDEDKKKTDMVEADLTKAGAGKTCKKCGKTYHADAKVRRCENCGKKLPKAMSKAAQALLTKAGIHNWKHGWVWIGEGQNPHLREHSVSSAGGGGTRLADRAAASRLHGHMAAHHEAMAKGKWAEAASHLHAASMGAHAGGDNTQSHKLMEHAGDIAHNAPAKSGKMTAAEKKLHEHLAGAHHAAAAGDYHEAERLNGEARAARGRLERRHGSGKSGEKKPEFVDRVKAGYEAGDKKPAKRTPAKKAPPKLRGESLGSQRDREATAARVEEDRAVEMARAERTGAGPLKPPRAARTAAPAPEKGLGHDSFGGRSRTAWQGEARRAGVKPRRGAPAHEIAGAVGEHQHRRAMERSLAINPGGLDREGQAAAVDRGVARFRAEHDAKVGRLGDSTGMGIYPTTAGNQAAHDARQHDEAARAAVSQGQHTRTRPLKRTKSYNGGIMAKNDTTAVEAEAADAPTYTAQRMHDALCPAYDWPAVTKAYPTLSGIADAIDPATFDLAVLKAADAGDATGAVYAGILHDNADIIAKGHVEAALLADARADLVAKGFGPPPDPADYQRGYIAAGHATPNAPAMRIPMVPPAVRTISPDDFHRGLITEGHQAESPSDRGDNNPVGSGHSGPANAMFGALGRAAATNTMKALHDHLVDTIPGMCPMADSRPVMPADMQANNRPEPIDPAQIAYAGKSASYDDPAEEDYAPAGPTHDEVALLIKAAVRKATKTIHKTYQRELDTLREGLDELGALPDPTQAPIRGAVTVAKAATTAPTAVPVERISLVEQAQLNKAASDNEYIDYLQKAAALDNPNPTTRQQAADLLEGLLTKAS